MILLLDFDGTLFHTEAFKKDSGISRLSCIEHPEYCLDVLARQGPLNAFLYPDTVDFLRHHEHHDLILTTFGNPEFQKAKIMQTGILGLFTRSIFTGNEMKGEAVKRMLPLIGQTAIFLDDDITQLQNMKEHCPHIISVRMKRSVVAPWGEVRQTDFAEVADLSEFARFIEAL